MVILLCIIPSEETRCAAVQPLFAKDWEGGGGGGGGGGWDRGSTEESNLLDEGTGVHSACAVLVRVIVHALFWHVIRLPDLSSLQSYVVVTKGLHAHAIC